MMSVSRCIKPCLPRISSIPQRLPSRGFPTCRAFSSSSAQAIRSQDTTLLSRQSCNTRFGTHIKQLTRPFSVTSSARHNHLDPPKPGEELKITFVDKEGDEHTFDVAKGDNLLDIALEHDIEMEGACGGSCACSTCHIVVESEEMYEMMGEPDDDENDMLDLAFGLTETSRLGCQIKMTKEMDGLRVRLPSMTRNLQASDFSKPSGRDAK